VNNQDVFLLSISETARRLQVKRATVADLVRINNIPVHPLPTNGKAKGLDVASVKKLKRILKPQAVSA